MRYLRRGLAVRVATATFCALMSAQHLATADDVSALRSDLLEETAHHVVVTLDRGHAELRVRRTVYNGGPQHDQATFFIDIAPEMVATGLRTLGTQHGRAKWFRGELLEAELAAARYRELTGVGGYYPKDPALLSWRSQGLLALQVFPCPPKESKTIEYTLHAPTAYRGGAHHLMLPALGTARRPARVTVRAAHPADRVTFEGRALGPHDALEAKDALDLSLLPARAHDLAGRLAVVPFADDRVLTHFAIDAPRRISSVPTFAHVVVIVDGSRSFARQRRAALAALDGYLSHFEGSRAVVQSLVFDREVRPLHTRFVAAEVARKSLRALTHADRNGSDVDRALFTAAQLLKSAPPGSARRIVLVTDTLTRTAVTPERLTASLGESGAVVHLAQIHGGTARLERNDDHPWARSARATGGLFWNGSAPDHVGLASPEDAAAVHRVYEEWARPLRVHRLQMHVSDFGREELALAREVLAEGEGLDGLFIEKRQAPGYLITGELWSSPVRLPLRPSPAEGTLWSALVFGSELLRELSEPEMMTLALRGKAVSPVTSYLAIEPGVRPSTEGIDWGTGAGQGFGQGFGRLGGSHRTAAKPRTYDHQAFLNHALGAVWKACGGQANGGRVTIESTRDEIVAVNAELDSRHDAALRRCLASGAWNVLLPAEFNEPWATWTVRL